MTQGKQCVVLHISNISKEAAHTVQKREASRVNFSLDDGQTIADPTQTQTWQIVAYLVSVVKYAAIRRLLPP